MEHVVKLNILQHMRVAAPCPMRWDDMVGNDRVRHCDQCDLSVYNLSALTQDEAELLLQSSDGRVCGAFFRREDGTILTRDCPVGVARLRARFARTTARAVAALGLVVSSALLFAKTGQFESNATRLAGLQPFRLIYDRLAPAPPPMIVGKLRAPPAMPPAMPIPKSGAKNQSGS